MTINVLFVCLGNICRSPTAEGVFQKLVNDVGLKKHIHIDSAGTTGWHQGRAPDSRTVAAAKKRGYDLSPLRARQVIENDFSHFHYILAMDAANLQDLKSNKPLDLSCHMDLFLSFSPQKQYREVPDPYHGGNDDFELVLDLVEDAAKGLLEHIRTQHNL